MITDIIRGHWNELLKKEDILSEQRLSICKECPLYKMSSLGWICNKDLYLNPDTDETSYDPAEGFYRGCNCRLEAKTRLPDAHCPAHKW